MTTDVANLDPDIRKLVQWLRANDFDMVDDGKLITCSRVAMIVVPQSLAYDADRLKALLWADHEITVQPLAPEADGAPHIDASYDACSGVATIILMNVHDGMLEQG